MNNEPASGVSTFQTGKPILGLNGRLPLVTNNTSKSGPPKAKLVICCVGISIISNIVDVLKLKFSYRQIEFCFHIQMEINRFLTYFGSIFQMDALSYIDA